VLFSFRGIRLLQVILSVVALVSGVAAVILLKAVADGEGLLLLVPAILAGLLFLWAFATTMRAPTSFVAVAEERTRIRFAGFVDTVVANTDIVGVRIVRRNILGGIGVRTNFRGDVALVSSWGEVAEITLRRPVRIWILPRILPARASRLQVSVRNPSRLVEHFARGPARTSPATLPARKMGRRGSRTR
jgi:hypothetical protein